MTRQNHHNEEPKRAALYARISQLNPPRGTEPLQAQVDRCAAYCLEHGYLVLGDQHDTEVQAGSIRSPRPALASLGEVVQQGDVAVVVVSSLDRLAPDSRQSVILVEEFKAARVTIAATGT
jgi:DNA invertase Pin-like site-specific DNA recombinase